MAEPIVAQKSPYPIELEAGKKYFWCACGRSQKQPFCDGSHKDTGISPIAYDAPEAKKAWFCGCKQTRKSPLCDGSHNAL